MATFTASNKDGYQGALKLISALKQSGIEAWITAGGVGVCCEPAQIRTASDVCKAQGGSLDCGPTAHQQDVLMQSQSGYEILKQATGDAIALKQEWEV